jgi:hypothetical protein
LIGIPVTVLPGMDGGYERAKSSGSVNIKKHKYLRANE